MGVYTRIEIFNRFNRKNRLNSRNLGNLRIGQKKCVLVVDKCEIIGYNSSYVNFPTRLGVEKLEIYKEVLKNYEEFSSKENIAS